jgi:AI-2 transport protein TqsA
LATIAVLAVFVWLVVWGFGRIGRSFITDAARYQAIYEQLTLWLEGHGITVVGVWSEHFNVSWIARTVQQVATRLNMTFTFWLIATVYTILGLMEVDEMRQKVRALKNRETSRVLLDGCKAITAKLRRYMLVRTLMSTITGFLVWGVASLFGLEFAAEWGVIAFALNYIPFIGSTVATIFPAVFALAQFGSLQTALSVMVAMNAIQFIVGSYLEPRVSGSALSVSPFMVLFSVFFWAYLLGIFGAFIGVPITIAVLTFCEQHPDSRWVSDLLGRRDVSGKDESA